MVKIEKMFVEYIENPIGIEGPDVRFSWALNTDAEEQLFSYRMVIKKDQKNEIVLDSGVVEKNDIFYIAYIGKELESDCQYVWDLVVCGDQGSKDQQQSGFRSGLISYYDWQAEWIGKSSGEVLRWDENAENIGEVHKKAEEFITVETHSVLMRKQCQLVKTPKRAVAYVCGLGFYELSINGKKVGDRVLTPLLTDYSKRVLYDTYDVTTLVEQGCNAITIEVGNGWYSAAKKYWDWRMKWYGNPRAILQIYMEYDDGKKEVVLSDSSWKISDGAVTANCLYDGEVFDAREEKNGWKLPEYNDSSWEYAKVVEPPCGKFESNIYPAIKVNKVIHPINRTEPEKGVLIYDFGVNISGWVKIYLKGRRGIQINIRYAEFIDAGGRLNTETNRAALNTDTYSMKGEEIEEYEPRFTFHGFRYAEITSLNELPEVIKIEACFVHSAVEQTGIFQCDNPSINELHDIIVRTQCAALIGVPIDCPQRDERLGWLGDAHITAEVCMHNFNMPLFYKKWLDDIKYQQHTLTGEVPLIAPRPNMESSADWSSAYSLIALQYYEHYGDIRILRNHYGGLKRYVKFLESQSTDYLLPKSKYGDWLSLVQGWTRGDPEYTNTLYFYYNVINLARIAKILGKSKDADEFEKMVHDMRLAINDKYYDKVTKNFGDGTQFSNAFALVLQLIPKEDEMSVVKNLVKNIKENNNLHLNAGILGTKYVMDALRLYGEEEVGYQLIKQKSFPSWMHMIDGRTTLPETWDRKGSGSHCMFGSVDTWFYKVLGGITMDPEASGFKHIIIKPYVPQDVNHVLAKIQTERGEIVSEWDKNQDSIKFRVKIPCSVTGELWVDKGYSIKQIKCNGEVITGLEIHRKGDGAYKVIS